MNSADIRERFLAYFEAGGHARVASSPLVPGNDPTLMFTNAGMVQFKDVFLGFDKRGYDKAATSQRCLRAGGKHNDLENVGYTARHLTFFEMLGNFSFGDYFKERAIPLAWELLTKPQDQGGYGLDRQHLWVTVFGGGKLFGPDSDPVPADEQAEQIWIETLQQAGFSADEAKKRVTRIPTADNFWMMGDTGPCGPCSEIFYNQNADAQRFEAEDPGMGDVCIEIWNLVFMQFNRDAQGVLNPLPAPCVDTGMGLERLSAVLQDKSNVFETDLFATLVAAAGKAIEKAGGTAAADSASLRVIADHIRAAAYLVADKVLPSNEGRGYVLRRIIRRALRHGHQLGAERPFFASLASPLAKLMGDAHPELVQRLDKVVDALQLEEERFARTLHDGMRILTKHVEGSDSSRIDGETVFQLYDTFGFPVDLTASYARDNGLEIDMEGFEAELARQRERSRAASGFKVDVQSLAYDGPATEFVRDDGEVLGKVIALYDTDGNTCTEIQEGSEGLAVLDRTQFYGEAGGQIGDRGQLVGAEGQRAEVVDTIRLRNDVNGHKVKVVAGELKIGDQLESEVDHSRRTALCRAHSATHLLHEALRRRLGAHVEQRGSLVEPDRLRFDFAHDHHLAAEDIEAVEQTIYEQVLANAPVVTEEVSYDEAIERGAKALFGEKYGATVRMVQIDSEFSIELCGGTHVSTSSEIGFVHLQPDEAVAAGVRRIEARTGLLAQRESRLDAREANSLSVMLKKPRGELADQVAALQGRLRDEQKKVASLQSSMAQAEAGQLIDRAQRTDSGVYLVEQIATEDMKALKEQARSLAGRLQNAAVMLAGGGDKVGVVCWVSDELQDKVNAKEWIDSIADILEARGGGKAQLAQAGGGKAAKVAESLQQSRKWIAAKLQ